MRLKKQIRILSWHTPVRVILSDKELFNGTAKTALQDNKLSNYLEYFIRTVEVDQSSIGTPFVRIVLKMIKAGGKEV